MSGTTPRRVGSIALSAPSIPVLLCLALIPTPVLAQPSVRDATAVEIIAPTVGQVPRFSVPGERIQTSTSQPQRAGSRDSLRNGAIIGAAIGAVAFGALAATLCHAYQEDGGASCMPDTLRFAVIGGAIGTGAGLAVDAAGNHRGVTVRFAIRF
jgi:hypothetical protein